MMSLVEVLREFWGLWLMVLFVGICAWALWPSRKRQKQMDDAARIPFKEDENDHADQR